MARAMTRRAQPFLAAAFLTLGLGFGGLLGQGTARAQGAAFECPPAASPAPATGGAMAVSPATATPVAFPTDGGDLTVFAAASLTDAFEQMKTDLEATNPALAITYNFAGSQALVTQLGEGAEADVFAPAGAVEMEAAIGQGSIAGEPIDFVRNQLAIVVPSDNPAGIDGPEDLAQEDLRLVLAAPEVPAGRYAREAICLMGEETATYGEGFVAAVAGNVVSEEEDVRDVLTRVRLGEADAGIVYDSDAEAAGDEVEVIEIPDEVNVVATYPIAAVAGGDAGLAAAFIAYVLSPEGQETLEGFGFGPVS